MRKVIQVMPVKDKFLSIVFSDGVTGIFDVTPYIQGEFFQRLNDEAYFRQVRLFFSGIGWPEGQDLGPDTIFDELKTI